MGMAGYLDTASSVLGYLGAVLIALAYLLNQKGLLRSEDWRFPAVNLLGSVLVIVSLFYYPNLPSAAIEVFWSLISIYGIRKNLRARRLPA